MRWDLMGGALGGALALFDLWVFGGWGLDLAALRASAAGWAVLLSFPISYSALGFLLGRLGMARSRARADAARIQAQLTELEASRAQVLQSETLAAIGRLAAGIAHEVRNPLGVIRASASLVQESLPAEGEDHRACELITDEIDRLDGLIGSLLAFAKPARLRLESTSLRGVRERAGALAPGARAGELELSGGEAHVEGDADLLTQLVLGLILNAGQVGATRVALAVRDDAEGVELAVADDGPGVAADQRERVFEPFFTTRPEGTGLGLAMAARIAAAHGGALAVDDDAALGGARFVLRLPRRARQLEAA